MFLIYLLSVILLQSYKISANKIYQNNTFGFQFEYSPTSTIFYDQKGGSANTLYSLTLKDVSLSKNLPKDDELYFNLEIYNKINPYIKKQCSINFSNYKNYQKTNIKIASSLTQKTTFLGAYDRYISYICLDKNDKTYLFSSSVSSKYGNKKVVDNMFEIINNTFKFK